MRDRAEGNSMDLDLGTFEVLTFDCYGTLIDWEAGILAALRPVLVRHGRTVAGEELLERYARAESDLEAGPYLTYRDVLGRAYCRLLAEEGITPSNDEVRAFASSVPDWPAFPDAPAALASLRAQFRLGVITNCDDDLFAGSNRRLGEPFEWIVTARQLGSYKPDPRNFLAALERIDRPRERILHVAQSLYHDHVPARELGLASVWIDRRAGRPGSGATPRAAAVPNLVLPDLASLAELATRAVRRRGRLARGRSSGPGGSGPPLS